MKLYGLDTTSMKWLESYLDNTLHFRISHTYGLIFFEKMVLRFLLIKYVWLIVFTVFSLKYGLLSGYEILGFWAIFMLRTLLLIVAELE